MGLPIKNYVAAAFLTFGLATAATAQTSSDTARKPASQKQASAKPTARVTDQEFIWKAAEGNYAEAQFAELILKQSKSDQIKSLAQMMIVDHAQADQELATIMEANNITYDAGSFQTEKGSELGAVGGTTGAGSSSNGIRKDHGLTNPDAGDDANENEFIATSLKKEHAEAYKRMQVLKGAQLDKVYLQTMQKEHHQLIKLFKNQLKTGQNVQLNDFAERQLPVLQGHLAAMEQMDLKEKPSSVEN